MVTSDPHRLLAGVLLALLPALAFAQPVTLIDNGAARCCVVVGNESDFNEPAAFNWNPKTSFLAWAAEDVSSYLGKMSGATIAVGDKPVEGMIPIYIGAGPAPGDAPGAALGAEFKPDKPTEYGDAYALDITRDRIVLRGESRRAVYYAAAQLLSDMGVRWYAPGAIGEVVPSRKTVAVETGVRKFTPDFTTRRIWSRPPDELRWMYRNRLGDATIPSGHSMHAFGASLPGWKDRKADQFPDLYARADDKPRYFPNMANPEVARIFASRAIEMFTQESGAKQGGKRARGFVSISPDDGYLIDERPEVAAMNSPGREPILGMPSFSDAWFGFLNKVCAEVEKQSPGLEFRFGSLAYMNYLLPPKKIKPDPRIIPVVAPIAFNRYVSMGTPGAPTSELLAEIFKGWVAVSPRVGAYFYNFNLADMAMPYTRRVIWSRDIPNLSRWGVRDFCAESHPNWHTMVPGNYAAARLLWDVNADVNAILDEFYPGYYGPAADAMRRYDQTLEHAYESTKVFAGGVWGMHRILTPGVVKQLDAALAQAEAASRGKGVYESRVETVRFSLNFARHYFAARDALNAFDLAAAERHAQDFVANYKAGYAKYPDFFGKNVAWSPNIERYFELFHNKAYKDAGRVAREGMIVAKLPDELDAFLEPVEGGAKPSGRVPGEKDAWRKLRTFSATLDEQGLTFFRGVIWYRHTFTLPPESRDAKTLRLWFGGLDSLTEVRLNGQTLDRKYVGTFGCWEVDLTPAILRDKPNNLLISVDNTFPNEIGTGGIVRPAVIYAPR